MAKNNKKRTKYLSPRTEFNPGTLKYEPFLPLKDNAAKNPKQKNDSKWIILLTLLIILIIYITLLLLK